MDRDRWGEIQVLYERAVTLSEAEREAFLDRECAGDASLRKELATLLDDTSATTFSEAVRKSITSAHGAAVRLPRIAGYDILSRIGSGGMGAVFEAEQLEPVRRRVAVKVIRAGFDSRRILKRFAAEQQALAVMDHPAIARVFDAGLTDGGEPYFTMELIAGLPLTEYCDSKRLSTGQRLDLFCQVCEGVLHAHLKGIIHRDIKPSNVLVGEIDGKAVPKIIDFGVSKAIAQRGAEETLFTQLGVLVGTPLYMSPEQAQAGAVDVDVRSDVYSLGVLLYELLVGVRPFELHEVRNAGWEAVRRRIIEHQPQTPSRRITTQGEAAKKVAGKRQANPLSLRRRLAGDLDWIVMKALEKDRSRRYSSPQALAEDIRRHLAHEPIVAHPPDPVYRLRRFVRRHRVGVSIATAALVTLIAFTVTTAMQSKRIAEARNEAQRRAAELEQVTEFQADQLSGIDVARMGDGMRAGLFEKVNARGVARGLDETAIAARAAELERLIEGSDFTGLALDTLDENIFRRASLTIEERFAAQPLVQGQLFLTLAKTMEQLGLHDQASGAQIRALEIHRRELGDDHPDTLDTINARGNHFINLGEYAKAEPFIREAFEGFHRELGEDHTKTLGALYNLGSILFYLGKERESESILRSVYEDRRRVSGDEDQATLDSLSALAAVTDRLGNKPEAESLARRALEAQRRVLGDDDPKTLHTMTLLALNLQDQGRYDEAEPLLREVLAERRRVLGDEHDATLTAMNNLGIFLRERDRLDEAELLMLEAWNIRKSLFGEDSEMTLNSAISLGTLNLDRGETARAESFYRQALEGLRRSQPETNQFLNAALTSLGLTLEIQERFDDAEALYRGHVERMRVAEPQAGDGSGRALATLGAFLLKRGKAVAAEAALAEALEIREDLFDETSWRLPIGRNLLGGAIALQSRFAEAEPLLAESADWLMTSEHLPQVEAVLIYVADAVRRVIDMYEMWHAAEPDRGHELRASEWRARLDEWKTRHGIE